MQKYPEEHYTSECNKTEKWKMLSIKSYGFGAVKNWAESVKEKFSLHQETWVYIHIQSPKIFGA